MVDILFSLAEIFIVMSFLFRDILTLRAMSCIGMSMYVYGAVYAGLHQPGMKALMFFSGMAVIINLIQIIIIIRERTPVALPEDLKQLYSALFSSMTTGEFKKLYLLAEVHKCKSGDVITEHNKPVKSLIAIKSGVASIMVKDKEVAQIGAGYFIGEMSYLTGGMATATVVAKDNLEYVSWKKETIDKLDFSWPDVYRKLKQDIAVNLIKKIQKSQSN